LQGKESKHSEIKQQLKSCTNRSKVEDGVNKWQQYMRSSYVHTFYLPYHYPINIYHPHYESRNPQKSERMCQCYRTLIDTDTDE